MLWSTFMISHWRLFGLAQERNEFRGQELAQDEFATPALYKYSRHPMYLGGMSGYGVSSQITVAFTMRILPSFGARVSRSFNGKGILLEV